MALLLLGVSIWAPFGVISPAYRAPVLAAGEETTPQHVLRADVGGQVRLLGYDLEGISSDGLLRVLPGEAVRLSLYWESQAYMDRDWSIFLHLLDADLEYFVGGFTEIVDLLVLAQRDSSLLEDLEPSHDAIAIVRLDLGGQHRIGQT